MRGPTAGLRGRSPHRRYGMQRHGHCSRTAFRVRQDRDRRVRPGALVARHRDPLHRRHRDAAREGRRESHAGPGLHRRARDARRPGQDAAPEGPRRFARAPQARVGPGGDESARRGADRPRRRQPLSVPGSGRQRAAVRRSRREYRHRRAVDDPLGGEERRVRHGPRRSGRLRDRSRRAAAEEGSPREHAAAAPGPRVRAHRRVRFGDRGLARRAAGEGASGGGRRIRRVAAAARISAAAGAAVRRKSSSARGVLRLGSAAERADAGRRQAAAG